MRTILCPTDFSQEANHAIEAGFYLAKKFNASLKLFHVVELSDNDSFNVQGAPADRPEIDDIFTIKLMERTKQQLEDLVNTPGLEEIDVSYQIKTGRPSPILIDEIHNGDYAMVIMGTQGVTGFQELLIGSNTEKIVRCSKVPVLSVKEFVEESTFKNIVFASSLKPEELDTLELVKNLQEAFDAELHIVRVNTPNNFMCDKDSKAALQAHVDKFGISNYTLNVYNHTDAEDGIICFAEEKNAGMIAMATHGRTGFAHLISGSVAEDLVNHARRPVLTINIG